jgi:hypothetical protein
MENGDEYIHSPFLPSDEANEKTQRFGHANFATVSKFMQPDPRVIIDQ